MHNGYPNKRCEFPFIWHTNSSNRHPLKKVNSKRRSRRRIKKIVATTVAIDEHAAIWRQREKSCRTWILLWSVMMNSKTLSPSPSANTNADTKSIKSKQQKKIIASDPTFNTQYRLFLNGITTLDLAQLSVLFLCIGRKRGKKNTHLEMTASRYSTLALDDVYI